MRRLLALVLVPLALGVAPATAAEIVIRATAIEPEVLHVPRWCRLDFTSGPFYGYNRPGAKVPQGVICPSRKTVLVLIQSD